MRTIVAAIVRSLTIPAVARAESTRPLLPMPASVIEHSGSFAVADAGLAVPDERALAVAGRLRSLLERTGGPALSLTARGRFRFERDPKTTAAECLRLVVTPAGAACPAPPDGRRGRSVRGGTK